MQRKPTMHDVARAAGVGTMTVSRVLNGSQHVAQETAERVNRAVAKLGYHPNEMARALRNFKSRTIGLIVPNLHDTFFATCAHSVNMVAKEQHYSVLITTSEDRAETEYLEAQHMMQRHVEGLIVVPAGIGKGRLDEPAFDPIPVIALDRPVKHARVDSVVVENERGAFAAVNHLVEGHGHRRILFLGYKRELYTVHLRAAGYARAMKGAGLPLDRDFTCDSAETATVILGEVLAQPEPPTAIFCANNLVSRHVLTALARLQVEVPGKLAVVSFDDLDLADTLRPALTVVRQPVAQMGRTAAQLLFSRLGRERPLADGAVHSMLGVELVLRESCGCSYDRAGMNGHVETLGDAPEVEPPAEIRAKKSSATKKAAGRKPRAASKTAKPRGRPAKKRPAGKKATRQAKG